MKKIKLLKEFVLYPHLITFISELNRILGGCNSILDVGCGEGSPLRFFDFTYTVGIDGYLPAIEKSKREKIHHKYIHGTVEDLKKYFGQKTFDACIAIDLIEHLPKNAGYQLLNDMESRAKKYVVIFTPNGFIPQYDKKNKLQEHLSGWTPGEMRRCGFNVIGIFGHKALRGEKYLLKWKPKLISGLISEVSQHLYTRNHPEQAAALLCWKKVRT